MFSKTWKMLSGKIDSKAKNYDFISKLHQQYFLKYSNKLNYAKKSKEINASIEIKTIRSTSVQSCQGTTSEEF